MRIRRFTGAILTAGVLVAGGFFWPAARAATPTAAQLAPQLRAFVPGGEGVLTQSGSPIPIQVGSERAGELAAGDVTGDGLADLVIGSTNGVVQVRPAGGNPTTFTPFAGYSEPLYVAVGNLDDDPALEIATAVDIGAPRIRAFNADGTPVGPEFVFDTPSNPYGTRVAVGNVVGDAKNEIITSNGRFYNVTGQLQFQIATAIGNAKYVAAANIDGDAYDEVIVGGGASENRRAVSAYNGDGTPALILGVGVPPLGKQGDMHVAAGVVAGAVSIVTTERHGTQNDVTLINPATGAIKGAVLDTGGGLSPAIVNGTIFTLDTGFRLITLSDPQLPDHVERRVTLYGANLRGLLQNSQDPQIQLGAGENAFAEPVEYVGDDDLEFELIVPAGVPSGAIRIAAGGSENPQQLVSDSLFSVIAHNPPLDLFVTTGTGQGGPHVRTFSSDGPIGNGFFAGDNDQTGVRVARGDLDGDGVDEIVTAAPPGRPPVVKVFNTNGTLIRQFLAYGSNFLGGVYVAVGDVNFAAPGKEIVTAPDFGGGPHVRVFNATGSPLGAGFFAYPSNFPGGVRVATADVDGNGIDEIVTAPGPGGGPHVRVWNSQGDGILQFMAYDPAFQGGIFITGADLLGDAVDEIVTAPGAGGGPHVKIFLGDEQVTPGFYAFGANFSGGVTVGRVGDEVVGPNLIAVGAGPGGGPHVRIMTFEGEQVDSFYAYAPAYSGGVFVAGGVA